MEVHISKTIQFEGKIYRLNEEEPFNGIVFNEYSDGQREYEGLYKNGKPNGNLVYWYENGSIKREGRLKNGSPIGKWTYYNSTSQWGIHFSVYPLGSGHIITPMAVSRKLQTIK